MTGGDNIYKYITTEGKRTGKRTALEYLQKNTGVFNQDGMLSQEQVDEMKARLKNNKGNIWHGYISINEQESYKIDTPEKCIELIKRTFPPFFQDERFHADNVDLMCALHLDRPHHLHIHFVFWEREPKYKDKKSDELQYRRSGKIAMKNIDNLFVRLGLQLSDEKYALHKSRDDAIRELKELTSVRAMRASREEIQKEIIALAKDLPDTGRITYGSKDMEPFRPRIDKIVQMLLSSDDRARAANKRFYEALAEREREVQNICGKDFVFTDKNISPAAMEKDLPQYHNKIDAGNIHIIADIEADYKRRQGNKVLGLCKRIKPNIFEYMRKYEPNDKMLKRRLGILRNQIKRDIGSFIRSFCFESENLVRDFSQRLQEVEAEIERERKKKQSGSSGDDNGSGSGETK